MPSRELWVFWRIENFTLLNYFTSVKSAPFCLRCCGAEVGNTQKFYIVYERFHSCLFSPAVQLCPCPGKASRRGKKKLSPLKFSFSALLATGEHCRFHDKGRILKGREVKSAKGTFENYAFLLKNRTTHLRDDSLTFLVRFWSDEPVFGADLMLGQTRVPISKSAFELKFDMASSVLFQVVDLTLPTAAISQRDDFEIVVLPRNANVYSILYDILVNAESKERVFINEFGHGAISAGDFQERAAAALETRGSITIYTELQFAIGEPVSGEFKEAPSGGVACPPDPTPEAEGEVSSASAEVSSASAEASSESETRPIGLASDRQSGEQSTPLDFTLRVGRCSFPVHMGILSSRSAVFKEIFEADARTQRSNIFEVTDVDPLTMDRVLRFFYFGDFVDWNFRAVGRLFAAAHRYRIESLRSRCVDTLAAGLCLENICGVRTLAETHGDRTLMAKTNEFLFRNADSVFRSQEWQRYQAGK